MVTKHKVFNLKAYAKINLFLHVLKKRKNGFHNLESLICFLNLYDEIKIIKNNKFSIEITGPFKSLLNNKENIIKKTVFGLSNLIGIKPNFKIFLNKQIPVSAGLGGGSADSAAIIRGINRNKLKKQELYEFAKTIGSDVPVCLYNKHAFFKGYGEILSKAPKLPKFSTILINPMIELSTKKVFLEYEKNFLFKKKTIKKNLNNKNFYSWILKTSNDLSMPAKKIVIEIKEILSFLDKSKNCLLSRMTGSGPTVFGLFKNSVDARNINKIIKIKHPNWWSITTSLKS